ncbi:MAG TPA: VWA domain-containing protein [Hyphomicrobium sp.]|nr:VWA domain-containing protein [Hyphomicrobium sp.]
MSRIEFEPWEPEESVGKLWHAFVNKLDAPQEFLAQGVSLDDMRGRLGVLFRGLGGGGDVEIKPSTPTDATHRLSWRRTLAQGKERVESASFDGETLRLPASLAAFPERHLNISLYLWQAAFAVHGPKPLSERDPLRADIRALQAAQAATRATLSACPGLRQRHAALQLCTRQSRARRGLPRCEAAVEAAIQHLLGGPPPEDALATAIAAAVRGQADRLDEFVAPRGYRTFAPVILWPLISCVGERARTGELEEGQQSGPPAEGSESKTIKASRKNSDQAARKDSLILHKFETILTWAEFLNINRRVDDDDADNAKKAAEDQNEIGLANVPQKAKARLRLHLDLSPAEADFERLAGEHVYPEWDHRTKRYLPDYCRVLAGRPGQPEETESAFLDVSSRRRIAKVRRQFEALRPRRVHLSRQIDGDDIDLEAALEARVDLVASGAHSDRVYRASRSQERDLAVSILLDASRSTESIVAGRQVLEIAREALVALAWGLDACGDDVAINAFSSLRRDRVFMHECKSFTDKMGPDVEARIAGLRPGHYTRLGAAIRHVSRCLAEQERQRRLLLVITDGKPNDLDHYEGRHGIEDTHMAVREARRCGQTVFGVTIDTKSQAAFARIFGKSGFAVVSHPDKLATSLPQLYRHLISQ